MKDFQQVSMFTFDTSLAKWEPVAWSKKERACLVLATIPENVLDPFERQGIWPGSNEWDELQKIWSGYVYAIARAIPQLERAPGDINGWGAACNLFKEHRENKKPIKLCIHEREIHNFADAEIIEYLENKPLTSLARV